MMERADFWALLCVFVTFPNGVRGQVWYLMVSIPDLCLPLYIDGISNSQWNFRLLQLAEMFIYKGSFFLQTIIIDVETLSQKL